MLFLIIIITLSVLSFSFVVLCPTCARLRGFILGDDCHVLYWLILFVLAEKIDQLFTPVQKKRQKECGGIAASQKHWAIMWSSALTFTLEVCAGAFFEARSKSASLPWRRNQLPLSPSSIFRLCSWTVARLPQSLAFTLCTHTIVAELPRRKCI